MLVSKKKRKFLALPITPDEFAVMYGEFKKQRMDIGRVALEGIQERYADLINHSQKQATPDSHKPVADAAKGGAR